MTDAPKGPLSHTALGKEVGLLAHELHNVLTVLFGVADALRRDPPDAAHHNASLLAAGVEKTEGIAKKLFALRQRTLEVQTADAAALTAALLPWVPGLAAMTEAIGQSPRWQADDLEVAYLLMALGVATERAGGITNVASVDPVRRRSRQWAINVAAPGAVDDAVAFLEQPAEAAGATVRRTDEAIVLEVALAPDSPD
ncbi:MAG: hypothetical protein CMJ83_20165 [Planctomycetes bacterium]|nr:hypothetical protein [Planctomycetota bacterium]